MNKLDILVDKVLEWSYSRNIINGSDFYRQYMKGQEEMGELSKALLKGDKEGVKDGIGDVLVCLINLTEQCNLTLDECLESAYNEIKDRKGVLWQGVFIKESDENYERIIQHLAKDSVII